MADTTTPNIKLTNQTEGGNNNTWGTIADNNFEQIDNKFGDRTSISTTGGSTTLSESQEIVAIIRVSGTLVSNATINFSGRGGFWIVENDTSGSFSVTCKVTGQTGVEIPQGTAKLIISTGTDIELGNTESAVAAEATVASASTTNILGSGSEFVAISGTATITSFGTGTNRVRFVRATGAFTITHNATTLICPGAADIVAVAGDTFIVVSNASSQARIYTYQRGAQLNASTPIGAIMDFAGTTAPTYWLLCYGQTLLRASYAALFAVIGTTYGSTDSTNFLLPDCRGRVRGGKDDMGGSSANRLTNQTGGLNGDTLGATGGAETHTLLEAQIPSHTHSFSATTSSDGLHGHPWRASTSSNNSNNASLGGIMTDSDASTATKAAYTGTPSDSDGQTIGGGGAHTHTVSGTTGSTGSGSAHNNVQPTIIFNTIIFAGI